MKNIKAEIDRRNLLRFLGNAAIALPFMRTLLETQAFGQANRKCAVFWYWPNGVDLTEFHPNQVGENYTLKRISAPLATIKSDLIITKNMNYSTPGSHEHGMNYFLTGMPNFRPGVSIDTVLGERIGKDMAVPVLRMGSAATGGDNVPGNFRTASFFAPGKPSQLEDNPTRTFESIFGNAGKPPAGTGATQGVNNNLKKSVLDASLDDLKGLQGQLGAIEKTKLDNHVAAIRELERRLQSMNTGMGTGMEPAAGTNQCTKVLKNTRKFPVTGGNQFQDHAAFSDVVDINIEIAIQAMACGLANVIYIQNSHCVSLRKFANGVPSANAVMNHHADSHYYEGGDKNRYIASQVFFMTRFANLVSGMANIKQGDKTLLYNSSVLGLSEFADCNGHSMQNVPVLLAGQCGGYFKTGRVVDLKNASHNQMLVSILRAHGGNDNTFGDPGPGNGELAALRG